MKENKSTPAKIIKQDGKKTIYKCGKNANNKEIKIEKKSEVRYDG